LKSIVADSACGIQRFFDVPWFYNTALLRVMCPRTSVEVGLQLQSYRQSICPFLTRLSLEVTDAIHRAEQILHVMTDFMRNNVRDRKIAWCPEATS
jgi:hypothetical protein